jgi:4-aminobutyrate aminotransferase-like enzyme
MQGTPARQESADIVNLLRAQRVLISSAGPYGNVLKIRPPLVFATEHADLLAESLDRALLAIQKAGSPARAAS